VEKYGAAAKQHNNYDYIIFRISFVFWINKATNTNPEYITSLLYHGNNGYANGSHFYVVFLPHSTITFTAFVCSKYQTSYFGTNSTQ
jgi:hypothetical protein